VRIAEQPRHDVPLAVLARHGHDGVAVLGPGADEFDPSYVAAVGVTGKAAEVLPLLRVGADEEPGWVVGLGDGRPRDWRAAGAALVRAADAKAAVDHDAGRSVAATVQVALPNDASVEQAIEFALGAVLGSHSFRVTDKPLPPRTRSVDLLVPSPHADLDGALRRARELASATALARDLANTPSDVKSPAWLADTAARLAAEVPVLAATVHDEQWLAEHGFGGVLAVGAGSDRPPRFVELTWRPPGVSDTPHLVFVGKGITFDTGGISVKPAEGMHLMRTDMSGGAAVIAALRGVAALGLPVRVTGLVPCAENHVSGSAYRPGDIVRHYGGTTTEVTNTDAEGRLVLADALAYAVRTLSPDVLVDVATLTGAMKVSLGLRTGGLFASSDLLAKQIAEVGERVGEAWWRMPLLDAHAEDVRSDIADVRQCPPGPGSITAALFLREFTGDLPWAHLDIAGPARAEKPYEEIGAGGTGFAARTLIELAASYA
jgi:leucyl aminopeptidase